MPDFSQRAEPHDTVELMDQPCSYEELRGCLRDIAKVNRLTLAHRPTLNWLGRATERRIAGEASGPYSRIDEGPIRIVDVGCGYGDGLRRIERWAASRQLEVQLTGIDLNPDAIRAAKEATPARSRIEWVVGDCLAYPAEEGIELVVSSLLTHHLEDEEIVRFLKWMEATARRGWFINDLHRKAVPYWVFKGFAAVSGWHPFVCHDGPVSIERGFVVKDWKRLCGEAGLEADAVKVVERRLGRLCVERLKELAQA
jgi:SAM-dependent methyltransferase